MSRENLGDIITRSSTANVLEFTFYYHVVS